MPKTVIIYVRGLGFNTLHWVLKNSRNSYIGEIVNRGRQMKIIPYLPLDHWVNELAFLRGENPGDFNYSGYTKWNWNLMEPERAGITVINRLFSKDIVSPTIYPMRKLSHNFYTIGFEETFTPGAIDLNAVSIPSLIFRNGYNEPVLFTSQEEAFEVTDAGRVVPVRVSKNRVDIKLNGMLGTNAPISFEILEEEKAVVIKIDKYITKVSIGEVSEPIPVLFRNRFLKKVKGYFQFYLKSITPHLNIYASPFSVNLRSQFIEHAKPRSVFNLLERDAGPVILRNSHTTAKAYLKDWIDRRALLKMLEWDVRGISQISTRVATYKDKDALIISYPYIDVAHHYLGNESVLWAFQGLDWLVGWFMHIFGIKPFIIGDFSLLELNKVIDLNRYFISTGILKLENIEKVPYIGIKNHWTHINYNKTLAFSLGGGRVFINRKNPDFKEGAVKKAIEDRVISQIQRINRIYGGAIKRIIRKEDIYSGKFYNEMPDIVICFGGGLGNSYFDSFAINNKVVFDDIEVRHEHLSFDIDRNTGAFISPLSNIQDVNSMEKIIDVIDDLIE
jgi:hypothetical protein